MASSTLPLGSQTTRRPRWALSTSAPRLTAASGASSGRPASPTIGLLIGEADDVEGYEIVGHPHSAHRDGGLAVSQVSASLPDQVAYLLQHLVVLAAGALAPQARFGHTDHDVHPGVRSPHRVDSDVQVAVDPEQVRCPERHVDLLPRLHGNHRPMFSESRPGMARSGTPAASAA